MKIAQIAMAKIKMRRTGSVVLAEKSRGRAWTLYALVTTRSLSPPVVASFLSTSFSLFFLFLHKTNYILDLSHICSTGRILSLRSLPRFSSVCVSFGHSLISTDLPLSLFLQFPSQLFWFSQVHLIIHQQPPD